MISDKNSS